MSEPNPYLARWREFGAILAPHEPTVLVTTIALLDAVLGAIAGQAAAPAGSPSQIAVRISRWNRLGDILDSGRFGILVAMNTILDAMIGAIEGREAARPGAPLTARRVIVRARYGGIAVDNARREPAILLASMGLDLADHRVREQLLELNRRGEIRLVGVGPGIPFLLRSDFERRGERLELIEESAIVDGNVTYHAVLLPPHDPPIIGWPPEARRG